MGLRAVIASAAAAALTAAGDIPVTITYRHTVTTYDPTTGTDTSVFTDYPITQVLLTKFSEFELGRNAGLQLTDQKALILQSKLSVTPSIQLDTIISGGKTYNIVNFNHDPAGATYTFQLRAP